MLFEWDTYFASMIAAVTDPWTARSNIIRMTKSLIYKGFVAGFWNGEFSPFLCGCRPPDDEQQCRRERERQTDRQRQRESVLLSSEFAAHY